jgi:RNA polymerase sigma factor (sigma-70 family)
MLVMELLEKGATPKEHGSSEREIFFEGLYKDAFPAFARFAAKLNASFEDAKDIFHDALVIFYEKSTEADFVLKSSPEAYIMGIAKHLWIRKFHRDRHKVPLDAVESEIAIPADFYPTVNEIHLLEFLETSGKKCVELLQKFYYEKSSLKEIAKTLGYSSEHSASVQKFKCIGKMREAIRSKAMNYEDFLS